MWIVIRSLALLPALVAAVPAAASPETTPVTILVGLRDAAGEPICDGEVRVGDVLFGAKQCTYIGTVSLVRHQAFELTAIHPGFLTASWRMDYSGGTQRGLGTLPLRRPSDPFVVQNGHRLPVVHEPGSFVAFVSPTNHNPEINRAATDTVLALATRYGLKTRVIDRCGRWVEASDGPCLSKEIQLLVDGPPLPARRRSEMLRRLRTVPAVVIAGPLVHSQGMAFALQPSLEVVLGPMETDAMTLWSERRGFQARIHPNSNIVTITLAPGIGMQAVTVAESLIDDPAVASVNNMLGVIEEPL